MNADVIDGDNVGMIECSRSSRFILEAPQAILIVSKSGFEQLEGNFPAKALIGRAVNLSHPSGADAFMYPIVTQDLASHCVGETCVVGMVGLLTDTSQYVQDDCRKHQRFWARSQVMPEAALAS